MLSAPPATAMSASPRVTAWAAETIACSPEPQSRFKVSAGASCVMPAFTAATRDRYMSLASVWMTLPNTTCCTSSPATLGAGQRLAGDLGAEFGGRKVLQAAAEVADSGADAGDDVNLALHGRALYCAIARPHDMRCGLTQDWHGHPAGPAAGRETKQSLLDLAYFIRLICFSLIARMKSGNGINPTASRYFAALPPSIAIDHSRKCRMAAAVSALGCVDRHHRIFVIDERIGVVAGRIDQAQPLVRRRARIKRGGGRAHRLRLSAGRICRSGSSAYGASPALAASALKLMPI